MARCANEPTKPTLLRYDALDSTTTPELLVLAIQKEGGVIVQNLISASLASQIKHDLKPHFDTDTPDKSGFFPSTTQRASGLLGISDACAELATNPLFIAVANAMVSSTHTFWRGDHQETVQEKPIVSSTVGFRVNPGGEQQVLHRDDKYAVSCIPLTSWHLLTCGNQVTTTPMLRSSP